MDFEALAGLAADAVDGASSLGDMVSGGGLQAEVPQMDTSTPTVAPFSGSGPNYSQYPGAQMPPQAMASPMMYGAPQIQTLSGAPSPPPPQGNMFTNYMQNMQQRAQQKPETPGPLGAILDPRAQQLATPAALTGSGTYDNLLQSLGIG